VPAAQYAHQVGGTAGDRGRIPEGKNVVFQCKTGTRSSFAASILLKAGRKRVYNLLGGIDSWKNLGYPLVKD
jgi:rhodanese-related sulfurtransferase